MANIFDNIKNPEYKADLIKGNTGSSDPDKLSALLDEVMSRFIRLDEKITNASRDGILSNEKAEDVRGYINEIYNNESLDINRGQELLEKKLKSITSLTDETKNKIIEGYKNSSENHAIKRLNNAFNEGYEQMHENYRKLDNKADQYGDLENKASLLMKQLVDRRDLNISKKDELLGVLENPDITDEDKNEVNNTIDTIGNHISELDQKIKALEDGMAPLKQEEVQQSIQELVETHEKCAQYEKEESSPSKKEERIGVSPKIQHLCNVCENAQSAVSFDLIDGMTTVLIACLESVEAVCSVLSTLCGEITSWLNEFSSINDAVLNIADGLISSLSPPFPGP